MTTEPTYTLIEAQAEMNRRACIMEGHDFSVAFTMVDGAPTSVRCDRCGRRWTIAGEQQ